MYWNLSAGAIGIRNVSLAETLLLARGGGFTGIDFSIAEAAGIAEERGVDYVKGMFAAANVKPGQWGLPFSWRDDGQYAAGLAALPKLAALGADLDCFRCATWMLSFSDERDYDANFEWHINRFRPVAEILKDYGVLFGIEFLGPQTIRKGKKFQFIHTLRGILDLADAIGTGNVGLLLDAWHHYTAGGQMSEIATLKADQIVTVHLNDAPAGIALADQLDNTRCLPGESGVIPLGDFLSAVAATGYRGPLTVEPFSKRLNAMSPWDAVRETAASLATVWPAGRKA